jgi:hypothetical protein
LAKKARNEPKFPGSHKKGLDKNASGEYNGRYKATITRVALPQKRGNYNESQN